MEAELKGLVGGCWTSRTRSSDRHPRAPRDRHELCGHYRFPAKISDLRGRLALAAGVEVFVRDGHLMIRALVPVPALYRGLVLHPDDEDDPTVFRLDLSTRDVDGPRRSGATPRPGDRRSTPTSEASPCPSFGPDASSRPIGGERPMTTSIDRLSSLDKLMLWASKRWPQDIGALVPRR